MDSNDSKQAAGQSARKTSALSEGSKCAQMPMTRRQSQEEVKRKLGCFEVWSPSEDSGVPMCDMSRSVVL